MRLATVTAICIDRETAELSEGTRRSGHMRSSDAAGDVVLCRHQADCADDIGTGASRAGWWRG